MAATLSDVMAMGKKVSGSRCYNGYTPDMRALVNKPQRDHKKFSPHLEPTVCSITGYSRPDDPRGRRHVVPWIGQISAG